MSVLADYREAVGRESVVPGRDAAECSAVDDVPLRLPLDADRLSHHAERLEIESVVAGDFDLHVVLQIRGMTVPTLSNVGHPGAKARGRGQKRNFFFLFTFVHAECSFPSHELPTD